MKECLDEKGISKAREFILENHSTTYGLCDYQLHYVGRTQDRKTDVCHMGFTHFPFETMIGVAVAVRNPDLCSNSFYKYLLDPEKSPYRKILDQVEVVYEDYMIRGFIIKSGLVHQHTAINLVIASRYIYEFRATNPVSFWCDLVKAEIDETVEFYLYLTFNPDFSKKSFLNAHSAFSISMNLFSLRNLLQANTLRNPQNLLKTNRNLSCNFIWSDLSEKEKPFHSYFKTENKIIKSSFSDVVKTFCLDLVSQTPSAYEKWKKENVK
jgi:hypothetical protein